MNSITITSAAWQQPTEEVTAAFYQYFLLRAIGEESKPTTKAFTQTFSYYINGNSFDGDPQDLHEECDQFAAELEEWLHQLTWVQIYALINNVTQDMLYDGVEPEAHTAVRNTASYHAALTLVNLMRGVYGLEVW